MAEQVEHLYYGGQLATRVRYENGSVGLYADGCAYCDREKAARNPHFPRHWASSRCESGKHAHCTCSVCW